MLDLLSWGNTGWGDEMARGAAMTVAVALGAFSAGLVFGSLAAWAKLSASFVAAALADLYTTVLRGVPELLVIYLLFFGGSGVVRAAARLFGYDGYLELNAFTIGVLAVGLVSGAYATEVIRGAVLAVPYGQIEAARALGMGRWLLLRRVLGPQALRFALPGLGNVWQATLKDTALVSVTALAELMRSAHVAAGATRSPFVFYTLAAAFYLLMTSVSTALFQRAETLSSRGIRRA